MCCLLAVLKTFYNLLGYAIHANLPLLRVVLTLLLFSATAFVVIVFAFQVLDRDYKQHLQPGSKRMLTLAQVGMGVGFMLVAADSIATQLAWGGPRNWYEFLRWNVFWNLSFALFLTLAYDQVARSKFAANELHQAELADLEISRQLDAARLAVLQAQIEPHFVFNALANVRRLLRTDGLGATALLDDLLHYLKAALPALRSSKTTLAQELDLVRSFLAIHQVRMGKRLHTQVSCDASVAHVALPPMALLTLVENALKHGLSPLVEGGSITVCAQLQGARVHVAVADTGKGMGSGIGTHGLIVFDPGDRRVGKEFEIIVG